MYICMYVYNGFTIEIYGFMHSLYTFWQCRSGDGIESRTRKIEDDAERVQMYGRRFTAQQKDERWQDNGDKKRLARHHPSDLLHSLIRERIGGGQHVANASSFAISCAPREAPDAHTYT